MAEGQIISLGAVMERWSRIIINSLKKNLKDKDIVASGKLLASIQAPVKIFGDKYVMEIKMEDYWKSVDQGTEPGHFPDVDKIVKWIAHKKIQPTVRPTKTSVLKSVGVKTKRKLMSKKDRTRALAQRIAFAIFKKGTIKRLGYKGSHFATDYFNDQFVTALGNDIREKTGKDIKVQILNFQ